MYSFKKHLFTEYLRMTASVFMTLKCFIMVKFRTTFLKFMRFSSEIK